MSNDKRISDAIATVSGLFAVVRIDGHYRVLATQDILADEVIFSIEGVATGQPTRHSVQVGVGQHIDRAPKEEFETILDTQPWFFLNHSCAPNGKIDGRRLVALRPIAAWEQLTFDYNTNEWELATPFSCRCGSEDCCGTVRGYRHLSAAARRRRAGQIADHLLSLEALEIEGNRSDARTDRSLPHAG